MPPPRFLPTARRRTATAILTFSLDMWNLSFPAPGDYSIRILVDGSERKTAAARRRAARGPAQGQAQGAPNGAQQPPFPPPTGQA